MRPYRVHAMALLVIVPVIGGCATWQPARVRPARLVAEEAPRLVRVHREEGPPVELLRPRIIEDRIEGEEYGTPGRIARVDLDQITLMEVRRRRVGRGIIAVGALASVITLLAVAAAY